MPEPFKNLLNRSVVENIAVNFESHWPDFDSTNFVTATMINFDSLELKERTDRIAQTMVTFLPKNFKKSAKILLASLAPEEESSSGSDHKNTGITGWAVITLTHYVSLQGQEHFDLSMKLLKEMTKRTTSEFGIRSFLLANPDKTLAAMKTWTQDSNVHIRRLATEGCRPRLPWAANLPIYIKDPAPVIELLEQLKDDSELYVRRSVANNLNDIAKDHPDLVADIAARWLKDATKERAQLVRHACRTLIKNGHKKTLSALGYKKPKVKDAVLSLDQHDIIFGDALEFSLTLNSDTKQDQPLMIDYIIHHQKANGKTTPKVFKWRTLTLPAKDSVLISKKHAIRKITTRVYHPGLHAIEVIVNGQSVAKADFNLQIP